MISIDIVTSLFRDCLFKQNELINNTPIVSPKMIEGITFTVGFNPNSLQRNKQEISDLIDELPDCYDKGWTFLCLDTDRYDNQWTGFHRDMELLMMLGLSIDRLEYCIKREDWDELTGGVPFIRRITTRRQNNENS